MGLHVCLKNLVLMFVSLIIHFIYSGSELYQIVQLSVVVIQTLNRQLSKR